MAHRTPGPKNRFAYAGSPAKQRHDRDMPDTAHNPNELGRIRILLPVVSPGQRRRHKPPERPAMGTEGRSVAIYNETGHRKVTRCRYGASERAGRHCHLEGGGERATAKRAAVTFRWPV